MSDQELSHQFETLEQQSDAATLGMWVFLATEVLFFGGLFLLLSDVVARWIFAPVELPVGMVTAILGGPFFLILAQRRKKRS